MSVQVRVENKLTDEERQRLFGWGENIFGLEDSKIEWRAKDWHIIIDVDGVPASHVGVLRHTVTAGERPVEVGGIGGVATVLEMQGRGLAHRGMQRAAAFMRDELKVEFGLLFCLDRLVSFYRGQGWQLVADPVEVEQEAGSRVLPLNVMVLPCGEGAWPAGRVRLNSLPW